MADDIIDAILHELRKADPALPVLRCDGYEDIDPSRV
jgi:hypothetical protein